MNCCENIHRRFSLLLLLLAFVLSVSWCIAYPEDAVPEPTTKPKGNGSMPIEDILELYDCKKVIGHMMKRLIKTMRKCTKRVKDSSTKEEFKKKMSCIIKCTMEEVQMVNHAGLVTKESSQKFLDDMIPKEAHEFALEMMDDCIKIHGMNLDPNDEYCKSYGEFVTCSQELLASFAEKMDCGVTFGRK